MKLTCFITGLYCVFLADCQSKGFPSVKPQIEVEIVNQSSNNLQNALAVFGDYQCKWGNVGKSASYLFYPHPITATAELHWDRDGKHHVEKLSLAKTYAKGKSGCLTFIIFDDRAEARFAEKFPAK
jgi:hypothetical protein